MPVVVDYSTSIPTVPLSDLYDRIMGDVRLCPESVIEQKAIDVIREFCRRTRAWRYRPAAKTVVAGQATYDITLPSVDAECIAIEELKVDGVPCQPKTLEWLDDNIPTWRTRQADDFSIYTQELSRTFIFSALPLTNGTTNGITYTISMQPALDATRVGEDFLNEYEDRLKYGIKGELMLMSERPWSNAKLGSYLQLLYVRERNLARIAVNKSFTPIADSWQSPYKFAGR